MHAIPNNRIHYGTTPNMGAVGIDVHDNVGNTDDNKGEGNSRRNTNDTIVE